MIPKIIHYCWFGEADKPELALKCIESWKKNCPDYEIIEWNEKNFDLNCCKFVSDAYKEKKWAFITDYVRLYAMVNYGGIYMDTDVEVCKSLDSFLKNEAFSGFQTLDSIPTGIMACQKGYPIFKKLLEDYEKRSFYKSDGSLDLTLNVEHITNEFLKYGLKLNNQKQIVAGFALYPIDYFCAKSFNTGKINKTENTYTVHHFAGSWKSDEDKKIRDVEFFCYKYFGFWAKPVFYLYKIVFIYLVHPRKIVKKIGELLKK